jgi:hypothetical protein
MKNNNEHNIDDLDDLLPDDLKGDIVPEINPEKLFDENEYSTIIIGNEGMSKKDTSHADAITMLVSSNSSREEKDEALKHLKDNNAQAFILNAISKTKTSTQKALVIAACWETGLDFSKDYSLFIDLICDKNFHVSFEAFTVIQEMEAEIDQDTLKKSLITLKKVKDPSVSVSDAIQLIEQKLNT